MRRRLFAFSRLEKAIFWGLLLIFVGSGAMIARAFWNEKSALVPSVGGEMTEGSIGQFNPDYNLNPLFADGIERDISNVIFAGLMRYDAETGEIRDFLATHTLSPDKKTYTFALRDGVFWHDGEPVTADDILFTFRDVIQNPDFPNVSLKETFADVKIKAIDEKTVSFTIPEARKTFFTNFTIGLLPRHILAPVPVKNLLFDRFNQNPIGAGPYRFVGVSMDKNFAEISLSAFPKFFRGPPKIEKLLFRIFPHLENLVLNEKGLDAIRPMMSRNLNLIPHRERFRVIETKSPRYLAVFFNLKNEKLTKKVRQALRAATPKNEIAEKEKGERIDTPLVELWPQTDIVNLSDARAGELLDAAGFSFREKNPTTKISPTKYISAPAAKSIFETTKNDFYLKGKTPKNTKKVVVNNYTLKLFSPQKGNFSYRVSRKLGTLKIGKNDFLVEFFDKNGKKIDAEKIEIFYHPDQKVIEKLRKSREQKTENPDDEKWRTNDLGEHLRFSLTFLDGFEYLKEIAEMLQKKWETLGVEIVLNPVSADDLRKKIRARDYELLLLPQHLGYNLDLYPYFHLSESDAGGFNLSGWKNLEASVLLEEIRATHNPKKRHEKLLRLRDLLIDEVPAIFLYTPRYSWLVDPRIKNVVVKKMATLPDRFSNVDRFFIRESRKLTGKISVADFFRWFAEKISL